MAEPQVIRPSYRGRVTFDQNRSHNGTDHFRGRRQRPHILRISHAFDDFYPQPKKQKQRPGLLRVKKLISGSDHAKRLVRLVSASPAGRESLTTATTLTQPATRDLPLELEPASIDPLDPWIISPTSPLGSSPLSAMPRTASPRGSIVSAPQLRSTAALASSTDSALSAHTGSSVDSALALNGIKPVASGNGVSVYVTLAEPVIYLNGFETSDPAIRNTSMLRGNLMIRVSKSAKIKKINMRFFGRAETDWPEGIPPKRADFKDTYNVIDHQFVFYDYNMGNSEHHGAHTHVPAHGLAGENEPALVAHGFEQFRKSGVFESITSAGSGRRLSLQSTHYKSFGKGEPAPNPSHKGYRTFTPGDYFYNFELPVDSRFPETVDVDLGRVRYGLEAAVERAGAFRANLIGSKEVQLVRAPSNESLEAVEPIAISRDWEDQLHYDIVISGKSFPLGSTVPIAFKLTPLAKVRCHRIKVFLTENIQYFTKDKKVHRMEPTRKMQLFEKRSDNKAIHAFPDGKGSYRVMSGGGVRYDDRERAARGEEDVEAEPSNMLGRLEDDSAIIGPTELELNVQLPSCSDMVDTKQKDNRIHFDTTYGNIMVNHWIKIVMRLSKADPENPDKRRHFEISIDSPLNILSCLSTQANTTLPSYSTLDQNSTPQGHSTCGCPNAVVNPRARNHSDASLSAATRIVDGVNSNSPRPTPSSSTADLAASIAPPPAAHLADSTPSPTSSMDSLEYNVARDNNRPIHLLRQPSFNPPAFDDTDMPPPLVTPPPQYESQFGSGGDESGLADYFQRLADEIDDSDDGHQWANRLEIPLTPGGRVNRSMDEVRGWTSLAPGAR